MNSRIPQSVIFVSREDDPGVLSLAAQFLCASGGCGDCYDCRHAHSGTHPDLKIISVPDGKAEIPVDSVRTMIRDASEYPAVSQASVFLIQNSDCLNASAQNALLKIIEEPPDYCRFILQTESPGRLLPTVRSRCAMLRGQGADLAAKTAQPNEKLAIELAALCAGGKKADMLALSYELEKLPRGEIAAFIALVREKAAELLVRRVIKNSDCAKLAALLASCDECDELLSGGTGTRHIAARLSVM
ncbi:MAG: hypothetical protein LBO63_05155 [Oscillospiraceae bacterium]|jgi:hypothetical protein|nr:hypothetical protein [Oscillospiraceae bacterium]